MEYYACRLTVDEIKTIYERILALFLVNTSSGVSMGQHKMFQFRNAMTKEEKIQIFSRNTGVFRGSGGFRDAKNPAALIDIRRGGAYNIRILDEYQEGLSCPSN